jgi:multiple sugar transport system ATP-binding protein
MASITLKNLIGPDIPSPGLNLAIRDRDFVVLTGPDAPVLSAIVRAISGLVELAGGEILLDDRALNGVAPKDRGIAFIARDFMPYPRLSVYENLALGLRNRRFGKTEADKRIKEAAAEAGLGGTLETRPHDFTAEQRQLLALARAISQQPKVYLFDDPFHGLSGDAQRRGRAQIVKLRRRATATVVYATSDPMEASALGGHLIFLKSNSVVQEGEADSLLADPANVLVASFLGDPPMNLIRGTLKRDRDSVTFSETGDGTINLQLPASVISPASDRIGQPVMLGIRPGDLEVAGDPGTSGGAASFRALADRIELKGDYRDIYVETGAHNLICRSSSWPTGDEGGHRCTLRVDPTKTRLFDAVSGHRITAQT